MAKEKTIVLNVETEEAIKNVEGVTDELKKTEKQVKKVEKVADKSMDGIETGSKKASKGVGRMSGAFKKLGVAIKASGIALIASAFAAIGTIASQQQGAVDSLATTMTALQLVFNDVISGGERFKKSGGISDYFASIMKDARLATKLTNDAALAQARVTQETLKSEIAAEKLRQTRDDVTKSFKERIDASSALAKVLDNQAKETIRLANIQLKSAQNQYDLNATVENHVALIEAETAVMEANNKVVTANSEQKVAHNGVIKEAIDWQREYNDAINNEVIVRALRNGKFSAEGEIDREIAANDRIISESRRRINEIEKMTGISQEQKAIMQQEYYAKINQAAEDNALLENEMVDVKVSYGLQAAKSLANALGELAEEGSKEQKAFAITGVLIDTAAAIIGTWRGYSSFGPWGTAAAIAQTAAIGVTSAKAIQEITNAKPGSNSGDISASPNIQPQAPQFNIVGESGENQIVGAINSRNQQPVRAYVVGSDISTQQGLDRNVIENATVI